MAIKTGYIKRKVQCPKCKKESVHDFKDQRVSYVQQVKCPDCGLQLNAFVEGREHEHLSDHKYHFSHKEAQIVKTYAKYVEDFHSKRLTFGEAVNDIIMKAGESLLTISEEYKT